MIKIVITESTQKIIDDITIAMDKKVDKAMTECSKKMARKIKRELRKGRRHHGLI